MTFKMKGPSMYKKTPLEQVTMPLGASAALGVSSGKQQNTVTDDHNAREEEYVKTQKEKNKKEFRKNFKPNIDPTNLQVFDKQKSR